MRFVRALTLQKETGKTVTQAPTMEKNKQRTCPKEWEEQAPTMEKNKRGTCPREWEERAKNGRRARVMGAELVD